MFLRLFAVAIALELASCGAGLETEALSGAPCPCASGQVCCALTQVCAAEVAECPEPVRIAFVEPSAGAASGGYALRLGGEGFDLVSEVFIGDRPCEPLRAESSERLTCTAPKGPAWGGAADIRLVGRGGAELAVSAQGFLYAEPSFVNRAGEWGMRRAVKGSAASLLRPDIDGPTWVFFGADSTNYPADAPRRVFEEPDAWRWADESWTRIPFGQVEEVATMTVTDFDNDGRAEVLAGRGVGGVIVGSLVPSMYEMMAEDEFVPVPSGIERFHHFLPIDLDGDHDVDIVACDNFSSRPLAILRNRASQGGMGFEEELVPLDSALACRALTAGDLNGDLEPEIFLRVGLGELFAIEDGGLVDITSSWALTDDLERNGVVVGTASFVDIDLDGDMDLVASGQGEVDPMSGGSSGVFASGQLLFLNQMVEAGLERFELAGRQDLTGPDFLDCQIDFDRFPDSSLRWGVGPAIWFDADLDGDKDALISAASGRCIFGPGLYINRIDEGRTGFTLHLLRSDWSQIRPHSGAAGDFDGDGDLDVVVNSFTLGSRAIYQNQLVQRAGNTVRHLVVRPISDPDGDATDDDASDDRLEPTVVVQLDYDGDDFEPNARRRSQTTGSMRANFSHGLFEAHFGLGAHEGPVWVRARFPDGSIVTREVPPGQTIVELRDCAGEACS